MKAITPLSLFLALLAQAFFATFAAAGKIVYDGLVLTSIDVVPVEGTERTVRFSGSIAGKADDETATFLENVRQVNDKDEKGKRLFEAETVTVARAKEIINSSSPDNNGKPLFCIHGFTVQPGDHLKDLQSHSKKFDEEKFTLIPVIWPSELGNSPTKFFDDYGKSRKQGAKGAGKAFKTLKRGIDSFPSKALICHSMGNYVLRNAADEAFKFDNIYMCAADVRFDLFFKSYIRGDETEPERKDGLRICKMLTDKKKGKVHVLSNSLDYALRSSAVNPFGNSLTRIGAVGHNEDREDDEVKGCIVNKYVGSKLPWYRKASHSYHFDTFAIKYYQENHV